MISQYTSPYLTNIYVAAEKYKSIQINPLSQEHLTTSTENKTQNWMEYALDKRARNVPDDACAQWRYAGFSFQEPEKQVRGGSKTNKQLDLCLGDFVPVLIPEIGKRTLFI